MKRKSIWLATLLLVVAAVPTFGQDQFGRVVAVDGDDLLVLKPFAGRGPPSVYVFRQDATGAWSVVDRLGAPNAPKTGEGLSASVANGDGRLLVGSGDADGRLGAHVYTRNADGNWIQSPSVPFADDSGLDDDSTGVQISLSTVMRILQPPPRMVATDGRSAVVGVRGRGNGAARVFEVDDASGTWTAAADFASDSTNDGFGSAVAIEGDIVLVGAPRHEKSGAVFVYARDPESGVWHEESRLRGEGLMAGSGFGSVLALNGQTALVGAPGADLSRGAVISYSRESATGAWTVQKRLGPDSTAARARFGSAISVFGDELWIGAPGMDDGRGRVLRFRHTGTEWLPSDGLDVQGLEPRHGFGSSVAIGERVAVVGVPGGGGRRGRAVAFTRTEEGGWSPGIWLRSGEDLTSMEGGEVPCEDGKAGRFDCNNVDLLAFLATESIGGDAGEGVSDVWGWTDPESGREYALVGRSAGAAFVDVTEPTRPVYLGVLPANRSGARDLKVYQDHLFFTGDGAGAHGLVVFDLTRLRQVSNPPVTFEPDATYDGIESAHNLVIDTEAGFAFPVGASGGGQTCGGGLHMVDVRTPREPTFAGCYTDTEGLIWPGRTHDAQCVVYRGPDTQHRGRQICFASNETALRIVDVTDKENPKPLAAATYPGIAYAHQGWLTEDQRYFYLDDELDELVGLATRTRTLVWDIAELEDPVLVGEYFGSSGATDHNLFIKGDRMYQANYQAGLSVIDISDPENPVEVGSFDTTPYGDGNAPGFNGAWTAYPFFASGTVIVSSMNEGLFILRPQRRQLVP